MKKGMLIFGFVLFLVVNPAYSENQMEKSEEPLSPWCAKGKVVDATGYPMEGVTITANCGCGTLMPTGSTVSDKEGNYELRFGPGFIF